MRRGGMHLRNPTGVDWNYRISDSRTLRRLASNCQAEEQRKGCSRRAAAAEFLALGHLLNEGVEVYKTCGNYASYDLIASPDSATRRRRISR